MKEDSTIPEIKVPLNLALLERRALWVKFCASLAITATALAIFIAVASIHVVATWIFSQSIDLGFLLFNALLGLGTMEVVWAVFLYRLYRFRKGIFGSSPQEAAAMGRALAQIQRERGVPGLESEEAKSERMARVKEILSKNAAGRP